MENGHIKRIKDEDIQSSVLEVRRPAPIAPPPPRSLPSLHLAIRQDSLATCIRLHDRQSSTSPHAPPPLSLPLPNPPSTQIAGANVSTAFISCPADPTKTLGIKLPFLVMIIKNLNKYFTFEVQVCAPEQVAEAGLHRRCMGRWVAWLPKMGLITPEGMQLQGVHRCPTNPRATSPLTLQVLDDKNVRRRFRASNYQARAPGGRHGFAVHGAPAPPALQLNLLLHLPRHLAAALLLPAVHHACQALHLHHAHAPGRGLEPGAALAAALSWDVCVAEKTGLLPMLASTLSNQPEACICGHQLPRPRPLTTLLPSTALPIK